MKMFLLTWNPKKSRRWDTLPWLIKQMQADGTAVSDWRCLSKQPQIGDRVFLLRQGQEPRGIVASGWVEVESHFGEHWNKEANKDAFVSYIGVRFDVVLSADSTENILPREELDMPDLAGVHWNTQASGILIQEPRAARLEKLWAQFLREKQILQGYARPQIDPDRVQRLREGAATRSSVNVYERNPKARALCLKHHGFNCAVCSFNFGARYGVTGEGYIHVHHLTPLSQRGEEHEVDPVRDLRPVCANCHAMLHSRTPPLSIEDLKLLLQ